MIKRIIDISEPAYLYLKQKQLCVEKDKELVAQVPVEDLGFLILQHAGIVVTQALITACQKNNVALIFCDEKRLPYSMLQPISDGHTLHNRILRDQIETKLTTKKRLWQQIVQQKIINQSQTLAQVGRNNQILKRLATKVKSGDPENVEAQAAQVYWKLLFGSAFRRNPHQSGVNHLLNYGYAIIRAMIARAVVGSGLHPALGLHHRNQYNGLCLADDLMEPFRPWVDYQVYQFCQTVSDPEINQVSKQHILRLISASVAWQGNTMPLMVASHYFCAELKRALSDSKIKLKFPDRLELV